MKKKKLKKAINKLKTENKLLEQQVENYYSDLNVLVSNPNSEDAIVVKTLFMIKKEFEETLFFGCSETLNNTKGLIVDNCDLTN
jgi:hypothetical protein